MNIEPRSNYRPEDLPDICPACEDGMHEEHEKEFIHDGEWNCDCGCGCEVYEGD